MKRTAIYFAVLFWSLKMAYITIEEIKTRISEKELKQLTASSHAETIDDSVIEKAINKAEGEINSYCAKKYVTPFSSVPEFIKEYCFDLTRIYLKERKTGELSENDNAKLKMIISELRAISRGEKIVPGASSIESPKRTGELPQFTGSVRKWTDVGMVRF